MSMCAYPASAMVVAACEADLQPTARRGTARELSDARVAIMCDLTHLSARAKFVRCGRSVLGGDGHRHTAHYLGGYARDMCISFPLPDSPSGSMWDNAPASWQSNRSSSDDTSRSPASSSESSSPSVASARSHHSSSSESECVPDRQLRASGLLGPQPWQPSPSAIARWRAVTHDGHGLAIRRRQDAVAGVGSIGIRPRLPKPSRGRGVAPAATSTNRGFCCDARRDEPRRDKASSRPLQLVAGGNGQPRQPRETAVVPARSVQPPPAAAAPRQGQPAVPPERRAAAMIRAMLPPGAGGLLAGPPAALM